MTDMLPADEFGYHVEQMTSAITPLLDMARASLREASLEDRKNVAIQEARTNLQSARDALRDAPEVLRQAEKTYVGLAGWTPAGSSHKEYGDAAYNGMLLAQETQDAIRERDKLVADADAEMKRVGAVIAGCAASETYHRNAETLRSGLADENSKLKKRIEKLRHEESVFDRRFWYEHRATANARWWLRVIIAVYYIALVAVFLTSPIHTGAWYKSPRVLLMDAALLAIPYFLTKLASLVMRAPGAVRDFMSPHIPKDVYLTD